MKKFFAIVLGLALVLGFASVASAEFSASGKIVLTWTADTDADTYVTDLHGDTNMKLKLSKTWDDASASLTVKVDNAAVVSIDGYEFAYAFSDLFTLKAAKSFEVKTPIWDDASVIAANIPFVADNDEVAFIGQFTLDGGWVKVATNLDPNDLDLAAAAEFVFDPVTVGGVVDVNKAEDETRFGIYAKYALTEEITFTGDMFFNDPNNDIALKAAYDGDPFTAAVTIKYDIDGTAGLYSWEVEGSVKAAENLTLSANYNKAEEYEVKAALTINEGPVFSVALNQDKVLTAKVEASF